MKIFAFIVLCLMIIFLIVLPGIVEYNKHKNGTKKDRLKHSLMPLLSYIGMLLFSLIFIILFAVFYKIFKNLIVAGILTVAIAYIGIKFFDR